MMGYALRSRVSVKFIVFVALIFLGACYSVSASASEATTDFFQDKTLPLVDYLDRNDGLSNLSVSSIIQDKFGVLWFGSQDGLNRYDGREIITYKYQPFTENGLPHNLIQTMYYDEDAHELWIGTYNGASSFDLATETFESYTTSDGTETLLSDPVVISITKDNEGYIWLGTASGLDRLDPKEGKIVNYDVPGKTVRSLLRASNGELYVGTLEGLKMYDKRSDGLKSIELDLKSKYIMTLDEFSQGIITLGVWGQGVVVINNNHEVIDEISLNESNEVYAMH